MTKVVVSGYFNPLHLGHIRMLKEARKLGDYIVVILNNDKQQLLKKGKIIMNQEERMEIVSSVRYVDEVFLSIDDDKAVCKSLEYIAQSSTNFDKMIFANGGDRDSAKQVPETSICEKYSIDMIFDCGGTEKLNSSTNINTLLGREG